MYRPIDPNDEEFQPRRGIGYIPIEQNPEVQQKFLRPREPEPAPKSPGLFSMSNLKYFPESMIEVIGRNALVPISSGFAEAAGGAIGGIDRLFKRAESKIFGGPQDESENPIAKWFNKTSQIIERDLGPVYNYDADDPNIVQQFMKAAGSAAAYYVPGVGLSSASHAVIKSPKILKLVANGTMTLLEASHEAGEIYKQLKAQGKSTEEANKIADRALTVNALVLGLTNHYGILKEGSSILRKTLMSGPLEGIQEGIQQGISNVSTGKPFYEGVLKSAAFGTIIGAAIAGSQPNPAQQTGTEQNQTPPSNSKIQVIGQSPQTSHPLQQFEPGGNSFLTMKTYDTMIADGGDATVVYKDIKNKIYQPDIAKHIISDLKGSFELQGQPELGIQIAKALEVDVNNLTSKKVLDVGNKMVTEFLAKTSPVIAEDTSNLGDKETIEIAGQTLNVEDTHPEVIRNIQMINSELPTEAEIASAKPSELDTMVQHLENIRENLSKRISEPAALVSGLEGGQQYPQLVQNINNYIDRLQSAVEARLPRPISVDLSIEQQLSLMKPTEARKMLLSKDSNVSDPEGKLLQKVGNQSKGFLSNNFRQKPELLQGKKEGVITDTYILINNKTIAGRLYADFSKKNPGVKASGTFPDWKRIMPTGKGQKASIKGYVTRSKDKIVMAILQAGDTQVAVDADKLAFMVKHLPNAEMEIHGERKPVVFREKGKVVGLLMPLNDLPKDIKFEVEKAPEPKKVETDSKLSAESRTSKFSPAQQAVAKVSPALDPVVKKEVENPDPESRFSVAQKAGEVANELFIIPNAETSTFLDKIRPAATPSEFQFRIDQLNKFRSLHAITARTGGISNKKAAGQFQGFKGEFLVIPKTGLVKLRDHIVKSPRDYMIVMSHELGHAIEFNLLGSNNKNTLDVFGKDLSAETKKTILAELKAVTHDLVGQEKARDGASYYHRPTELLARFFQKMFESPGNLNELAPTALEHIEKQSVNNPLISDFIEAASGSIDKPTGIKTPNWFADRKQIMQKYLGYRAGSMAYGRETAWRAMRERAKIVIEKSVKEKFKNIKDDAGTIFAAVESIKVTKDGEPEFGTRDFEYAKSEAESVKLASAGWVATGKIEIVDGKAVKQFAKARYTPEQAKQIFDSLSPEGQQLVKDFTASRDEAKDFFNRELIKDINEINSNIEGWAHRYWEDSYLPENTGKGQKFRFKTASSKKFRSGEEGYVQDLKKSMTRALVDLQTEKSWNDFIEKQFARVTKPIAEGAEPEQGWVEVVGKLKTGIGRGVEKRTVIIKDDKGLIAKQTRYQMPQAIYSRYKLITEGVQEATLALRIVNNVNRYWRINILAHPGTATTNVISGSIQYSSKVLSDFYKEALSGNLTMPQTKKNISAMITTLTPKGWANAPDWIYGSDLSNFYGQFSEQKFKTGKKLDIYGDKVLKLFSIYERYWKKVIITAENGGELAKLDKMTKEGLIEPTEEENDLIAQINSEVDMYAYDYDNVPLWMESWQKSPLGGLVKPFITYPYKYAKQITSMVNSAFDQNLPWEERVSKIMALSTIMFMYAAIRELRKKKQLTPEGGAESPAQVSPRGRFFLKTDSEGKEIFTRTAKYPFINLSETGLQLVDGNFESATNIATDMLGSVGPLAVVGLTLIGYKNKYQTFTPTPIIIGQTAASFVPLGRVITDFAKMLDPYQRKPRTFGQTFTSLIPVWTDNESLRVKLRGEQKFLRIPIEGAIEGKSEEGFQRTTTDEILKNYWPDIMVSMLTGVYVNRIDPEWAKAFLTREEINRQKKLDKDEE